MICMRKPRSQAIAIATVAALSLSSLSFCPANAQARDGEAWIDDPAQNVQDPRFLDDLATALEEDQAETGGDAPAGEAPPQPRAPEQNPGKSPRTSDSDDSLRRLVYELSQLPFISTGILGLLGLLGMSGDSMISIGKDYYGPPINFPYPVDESITEVQLLSREVAPSNYPDPEARRLERWTVSSPSMGRVMTVDVRLPKPDAGPAPILFMLDGLPAPVTTGWLRVGSGDDFDRVLGDENVTAVFPVDAEATLYSDWVNDDPAMGRQKWETFIATELLPLLDAEPSINSNGKHAIGGLSMGATGAMHLANQHADKFNAVFGISGCYSTMDPVGGQAAMFIADTRGAKAENLWGPIGGPEWRRHDVVLNPEGLRNQAVYLSSATGALFLEQYYSDTPLRGLAMGSAMEASTYQCTRDLDKSMRKAGMRHQKVNYRDRGTHNWDTFRVELEPAWSHIKPALY